MTADIVDAAAGLGAGSLVALLRRQREVFVRHTQGSHDVLIAPGGTVGRTSSGKVQRAMTRARYERGENG